MKTYFQTKEEGIRTAKWHVIDATGVPVGRLASEAATLMKGKHKPTYTPHQDSGDFVIVINAEKAVFTGNKPTTKEYFYHTGYFGGIKSIVAGDFLRKNPAKVIDIAVRGMLPKGPLGRRIGRKLKVFTGDKHPHSAQQPQPYELDYTKRRRANEAAAQGAAK